MAVCNPTPISTLFSTSISYIATTYTTSTLITVSPTSIISATTISSCLSINFVAAAVFPLSSSAGSSSSSSISRRTSIDIVNASSTFTSYTIEISPSHSQHKGSSVESSVSTSIALETTSSKTYSNANASALTSSTHVETRPSSSSTRGELPGISSPSNFAHESLRASQHSSRRPMTSQVLSIVSSNIAAVTSQRSWILVSTQVPTFSAEASERMPLGGTSKATSPAHDVDSSSRGLRGRVKVPRSADVGACASWTVMLSHVTAFPTPTTSWSIMTSTTWKTTLMVVPIGTLYKSCPPSVTATPVAATSLSQPETTTTPEAETPVDSTTSATPTVGVSRFYPIITPSTPIPDSSSISSAINPYTATSSLEPTTIIPISMPPLFNTYTYTSSSLFTTSYTPLTINDSSESVGSASPATLSPTSSLTSVYDVHLSLPTKSPLESSLLTALQASSSQSISSQSISSQVASSPTTITTLTSPSSPVAASSSSSTNARSTIQNSSAEANSPPHKAVSAGAAVGGVFGVFLLVASFLLCVRWVMKRKRVERTRELRSSWFYGNDLGEPGDGDHDEGNEAELAAHEPQSRFSAPSPVSRTSARFSRAVPAFLALPISRMQNGSGRFPRMMSTMRSSILAARPAGSMQTEPFFFAQSEAVPARPTDADGTLSGVAPRAPPPRTEPTDPHIDVIRSSSPVRMVPTTAGTTAGMPTWASPPRLELPPHEPVFDWGHSYDTPALRVTHAIESFYSQPETLPSMYAQSRQAPDIDMSDVPIGQAVSAPGRVSPFKVGSFPLPPTSRPFASSSRTLLPPPNHVTSTSRPPLSSIFEYTDFADSRHVSTATTRSHETDPTRLIWNSYEKPLWDRQSSLGDNSIDGGVEREEGGTGRSRSKSLKSVRWGDEEEESGIFGLARAL